MLRVVNTLNEILSTDTKPNKDAPKKEENKVDAIMDMLDKDVIETKTIDGLISPETETDFHLDSFEFENNKKLKDFDDDNND